jgi:hypothetical protein
MDTMALGLPGLSVHPGTHLCGFFRGEQERNNTVMPFYSFLRIAGEMTGTISDLLGDELIEYESELNRFVPHYPQVVFCLYDLDHFSGQQLIDVMRTHPKIVMGGTILENLYYVEPDEFLASRR